MSKPLHFDVTGQLCILSIDDDEVNLMVIEQLLRPQGWKVISAMDGNDAYESIEGDTWPDFVFLDYTLNVGDSGDEVCRKLREKFGNVPIPIVMCTALTAGHKALDECKQKGATDHLLKPYDRLKMIAIIEQYCGDKAKQVAKAQVPALAAPVGPKPVELPAPSPEAPMASSSSASLETFLKRLDLEYCGKKLEAAGFTMDTIKAIDDAGLRKAGIVIKGQRDKILEAVKNL